MAFKSLRGIKPGKFAAAFPPSQCMSVNGIKNPVPALPVSYYQYIEQKTPPFQEYFHIFPVWSYPINIGIACVFYIYGPQRLQG